MSPATGWMWFQKAYPIRITNHSSGRSELSCKQTFVDKILSIDQTNSANFIEIHQTSSKFIMRKSVLPGKCLLCREADGDICNGSEGEWRHEDTRGFMGIDGFHFIFESSGNDVSQSKVPVSVGSYISVRRAGTKWGCEGSNASETCLHGNFVNRIGENKKVFSSQDPFKYKCFVAFVLLGANTLAANFWPRKKMDHPNIIRFKEAQGPSLRFLQAFKRGDLCNDDLSAYLQVGFCKIGPTRYTNIPDHTWMSERLRSLVAGWSAALLKQKPQIGAGSVRPAEMVGAWAFGPPGLCSSSTPKHKNQSHVISTSVPEDLPRRGVCWIWANFPKASSTSYLFNRV